MRRVFHILLILVITAVLAPAAFSKQSDDNIRLILQLTVDGLRADLLSRYADRFGEGGFLYLKQNGTVFANAHYQWPFNAGDRSPAFGSRHDG